MGIMVGRMGEQTDKRRVEEEAGRWCGGCGYELRGLAPSTRRCPECGRGFDPADRRTYRVRPIRRWVRRVVRGAVALGTVLLILAGTWGWFYWGWSEEQAAARALDIRPNNSPLDAPEDPESLHLTPVLGAWARARLGAPGFVFDRATCVNLSYRRDITDLGPLAKLGWLREIEMAHTPVTDLRPLAGLRRLERLDLGEGAVVDIGPLAGLANLEVLDLTGTKVRDLRPLAGLTKLRELGLSLTAVDDVAPLEGLTGLQKLRLGGARVVDVMPLRRLTELRRLDLWGTGVREVTPLKGLVKLEVLTLNGTKVADIAPLRAIKTLRRVYVSKGMLAAEEVEEWRRELPGRLVVVGR